MGLPSENRNERKVGVLMGGGDGDVEVVLGPEVALVPERFFELARAPCS